MFKTVFAAAAILVFSVCSASAHGVWVGVRFDQPCIILGDGPADNAYTSSMVTKVQGFKADFSTAEVKTIPQSNHVDLEYGKDVAIIALNFDYGYWSNGPDGKFIGKPMTEVPGSTIGTHAIKYSVAYLDPTVKPRAIEGLAMQFVPSVNPASLKMGDTFEVQLLHNGKPMANTPVISDVVNDLTGTILTDANGKATITVRNNALNVIGVEVAEKLPKNDMATQNKYFAALSFTCYPEEE